MNKLLDFIFIPNGRCPICYRVIFFSEDFICQECESKLEIITGKKCKGCGKAIKDNINYCSDCITHNYHFQEGFSLYHYEGSIKTIVYKIKFENYHELAEYMGKQLGKNLETCNWLWEVDLMIPVPLHQNREKERGYNQSERISRGILTSFVDYEKPVNVELNNVAFIREKNTPHQLELSKEERFHNVKNAFKVIDEKAVKDKVILLIDDVYTTGATLEECSAELMKHGAEKVYFAVLASGRSKII